MGVLEKSFLIVYKGNALRERGGANGAVFHLQIPIK